MPDLTPEQINTFERVARWAQALQKVRKEIRDMAGDITALRDRRDALVSRATALDARIQNALAQIPGGTP